MILSRPIVMISSTARDLPDHREQVRLACEQAGFAPHEMMEHIAALDADAVQASIKMVDDADVYIGVFAFRYGYVPDGADISVTEMEYNRAVETDKPRLIFFMDGKHPITPDMVETGDGAAKLAALKERAGRDRVAGFFKNPDDLRASVISSLSQFAVSGAKRLSAPQKAATPSARPSYGDLTASVPLGPNPYVGLEAFRLEDAKRFFGREDLIKNLWQHFVTLHGQGYLGDTPVRLLAILGASGSGKSSASQAGLLAEIQKRPLPGRSAPKIAVFTPEARPLESLARTLAKFATDDTTPVAKAKEFEKVLRETDNADGLRFLADSLPGKPWMILLVDQFEEVYSLCDDKAERLKFIDNILNAAKHPDGPLSILLTLRSDFLGAVNSHREFSRLIAAQNEVVPVMSEDELRRAIQEPAKVAGRPLDPAIVDLLIEQSVGEQGALPLLEFALARIWDGLVEGKAESETLRELGGVGGALAKEAQKLFEGLRQQDQTIAKRAFLAMVRLGEGTRDTRRRALVDDIVAVGESRHHVRRVLALFSNPERRLITLSATEQGEQTAEVSHEALIDHWSDLRDWLDSERDDLRFHRRLNEAATAWKAGQGGLWSDVDLGNLLSFASRHQSDLTPTQLTFFHASESRRRRAVNIRRLAVAALAALTVVSAGFGWYASEQQRIAHDEAKRAELQSRNLCIEIVKNFVNVTRRQLDLAKLQADTAKRRAANLNTLRKLDHHNARSGFFPRPRMRLPELREENSNLRKQAAILENEFSGSMDVYIDSITSLRGLDSTCIQDGFQMEERRERASVAANLETKRMLDLSRSHINKRLTKDEMIADIHALAREFTSIE